MNPPLIVIVGPTASGKSDFAIKLARKYGGEIICADSRTVYKGMDIGTAKPTRDDQLKAPHHLLDVVEPNQPFTASNFKGLANKAIKDIWVRGKWPIMVGGSGLYVDAVIFDYDFGEPANLVLRQELNELSVEQLQKLCRQKHIELPENYLNKRYLIRAIELGGLIQQNKVMRTNTIVVGLAPKKETLVKRVEQRAYKMLESGIVSEVALLGKKYGWNCEAMKSNIYRVFKDVVTGEKTQDKALEEVIRSDAALIKKQLTWFKRNPYINWGKPKDLELRIKEFIQTHSR